MTRRARWGIMWVAAVANASFLTVAADHHHNIEGGIVAGLTAVIVGWCVW